jgi:U3 small nucleolar RNA-associated protein 19
MVYAAITSLDYIFTTLLHNGSMDKATDAVKNSLAISLKKLRDEFMLVLLSKLGDADLTLQTTSLEKFMNIVKQTSLKTDEFQNNFFKSLCHEIISIKLSVTLMEMFVSLLNKHDDLRFYFFKNTCSTSAIKHSLQSNKIVKLKGISQWLLIMSELNPATETPFFFVESAMTQFGTKQNSINDFKFYKKMFSESWLAFLSLQMNFETYSRVLEKLHDDIIPNINEPVRLMDFLVEAYDAGGIISILALNGLFTLINDHNLDYPHFFDKFYALFDSNLMHAMYLERFFVLVEMFLKSTHLPNYMVCAFIKRMLRLSLNAPPGAICAMLPIVFNIFKVHPSAIILIHNTEIQSLDSGTIKYLLQIRLISTLSTPPIPLLLIHHCGNCNH